MSKFEYILPSGATFVVNGPPGATQAQADRVFYEQVAAGSLVGYTAGQTLTSKATRIAKFELSRLDRGTAGVDTNAIIAIAGDVITLSEVSSTTGLTEVPNIPNLSSVQLQDPITEADIAKVTQDPLGLPGTFSPGDIGPVSGGQVQALLAQIANLVGQDYNEISYENGVGRYGLSCLALERAGYVKPGTSLRFLAVDPEEFVSVMSSPGIWTGFNGVTSLDELLQDPSLQAEVQTQLMSDAYISLQASGAIASTNNPPASLSNGTIYYQGALQQAATLTSLVAGLGLTLNSQGILTANSSLGSLVNTFGSNLNLSTLSSGAINSVSNSIQNLFNINSTNISLGLANKLTGDIGALITNGSIFGSNVVTNWANGTLNSITGSLGNLTNLGGLTNIPSLSSLASNLDVFGKMSQFSNTLSNPFGSLGSIGNLSNINLAGITGSISGALSNITNGINLNGLGNLNLASLGNLNLGGLTSSLTGSLGSLAGGLNLGSLASLGSLGGLSSLLGGLGGIGGLAGAFGGGGSLVSTVQFAAGFTNTVNRSTVDSAMTKVLGSSKIPTPTFEFPSIQSAAAGLDIQQAKNILGNLNNGSGLLTAAGSAVGLNSGQISGIRTTAAAVNRLIG